MLGEIWDITPKSINIKNCSGFGILLKIENRDVVIDTKVNLLEGAIAVKEKVVIKIKINLTIFEYGTDRNIRIYI